MLVWEEEKQWVPVACWETNNLPQKGLLLVGPCTDNSNLKGEKKQKGKKIKMIAM